VLNLARRRGILAPVSALVAVDSTGLESQHISHYYGRRCGRRMKYFPKLSAVCDTGTHLFLGVVISRGPSWDHEEFRQTVLGAHRQQPFEHLVADAACDMERCHGVVRHKLGAKTTIRLRKRPRPGQGRHGEYRQEMEEAFDREAYGQRWQIESAFSRCKRRLGSSLKARNVWAQQREIEMRVLTHNLMIT